MKWMGVIHWYKWEDVPWEWIVTSLDVDRTASRPSYGSSLRLLLTKMPLIPHEIALHAIQKFILESLIAMRLDKATQWLGQTTVQSRSDSKEPDCSWALHRLPHGHPRNILTVALEVRISEKKSKLSSDVRFWLNQPKGAIKIVIDEDMLANEIWNEQNFVERWHIREIITSSKLVLDYRRACIGFCHFFGRYSLYHMPKHSHITLFLS